MIKGRVKVVVWQPNISAADRTKEILTMIFSKLKGSLEILENQKEVSKKSALNINTVHSTPLPKTTAV